MKKEKKIINGEIELVKNEKFSQIYKTDSIYMGINVAHLRHKQLTRGADSRLNDDCLKHKNTIIAVEEVKQGLVKFEFIKEPVV
jgi:DNA-directed RNA polymerase subunit K/omega